MWIAVANAAERYGLLTGVPATTAPWARAYAFRSVLAHLPLGDIDDDVVWGTSKVDLLNRIWPHMPKRPCKPCRARKTTGTMSE